MRSPRRPDGPGRMLNTVSIAVGLGITALMLAVGVGILANQPPDTRYTTAVVTATPDAEAVAALPSPVSVAVEVTATPVVLPPTASATLATAETDTDSTPTGEAVTEEVTSAATDVPAEATEACQPPPGWELHHVLPGETLFAYVLGANGSISTDDLRRANCLGSDLLQVGQALYLPPGAAENAPSSDPAPVSAAGATGPRTPACDPHCTISIRPGWRTEQIAAALDNLPVGFWGTDFLAAVGPGAAVTGYGFLASRPAGSSLEGFLFPSTYELNNAHSAADFRDMLLAAFAAQLPGDAEASAAAHGLTLYQAVTLASIIQRESWAYSEQVMVSSVFHNRLGSGERIGSTATVQYVLGGPGNWWPRLQSGQVNTASPYNTMIQAGLPPGPIANPGSEALLAALHPADTGYFYFTGNCQGSGNLYAATYEEHLANVNACR